MVRLGTVASACAPTYSSLPLLEKDQMQQQQKWITCMVYPGMFSDELVVEINDRSFFVSRDAVRKRQGDRGEILVTVVEADGKEWAVVPTSTSETVPLGA